MAQKQKNPSPADTKLRTMGSTVFHVVELRLLRGHMKPRGSRLQVGDCRVGQRGRVLRPVGQRTGKKAGASA